MKIIALYGLVIGLVVLSCTKDEPKNLVPLELNHTPSGFPAVVYPEGNEFSLNRWALGKRLFYEPLLSKDETISCASCHNPTLAFADDKPFSLGVDKRSGVSNTPTLTNVAYHPYYNQDGGVPTLEMQILVPIQEHNEFDNNIVLIADTLSKIESYQNAAIAAYNQPMSPFVISRALAQFERSLISGQSPYDLYIQLKNEDGLSPSAKRGLQLFESDRLACSSCHTGFNFTNYTFQNNGLYVEYKNKGRARLTQRDEDQALFKVPTLRNIALTAPYMHDGSMNTLEEVIAHYNSGGKDHPHKNTRIKPLQLTDQEQEDLISFLRSLTDETFTQNKKFHNE